MGGFLIFIIILIVGIIICRAISEAFPSIKIILQGVAFVLGIIVWILNGFWWGLLAWLASAFIFAIIFGTPDETDPKELINKPNDRPREGVECMNCKSNNTYKLSKDELTEMAQHLYESNIDFGRIYDGYKCRDCGEYMWYEDNSLHWTYKDKQKAESEKP